MPYNQGAAVIDDPAASCCHAWLDGGGGGSVSRRREDDEPSELELQLYRRLLEHPERWWTETNLYYRQPARIRSIRDTLEDSDWLRTDEDGRLQLTEAGKGALTWVVRTGGRERGVIGTFLWEGGTAARQRFSSRYGKRRTLLHDELDGFDELSGAEFEKVRVRGFWWTLPRYGLTAARLARLERRQYRRRLSAPYYDRG